MRNAALNWNLQQILILLFILFNAFFKTGLYYLWRGDVIVRAGSKKLSQSSQVVSIDTNDSKALRSHLHFIQGRAILLITSLGNLWENRLHCQLWWNHGTVYGCLDSKHRWNIVLLYIENRMQFAKTTCNEETSCATTEGTKSIGWRWTAKQ